MYSLVLILFFVRYFVIHRWVEPVISSSATVREAIVTCIDFGLSGMMVVDRDNTISASSRERGRVLGMLTSRDLLRFLAKCLKEEKDSESIMQMKMSSFMTPLNQVIYARPDETIGQCRTVMSKLGIKCMPVLSQGRVEGLITQRDLSDYGTDAADRGGKKSYLVKSDRVGLSSNTSMAEPPVYLQAHLALEQTPLYTNIGVAALPHPFKTENGVGMNRRDHGPNDFCTDVSLSEDACFVTKVRLPDETSGMKIKDTIYMGVADGVGSWRQHGVDPRDFSHALMRECRDVLLEAAADSRRSRGNDNFNRAVSPSEILSQAYERVKAEDIIGSSTACVALFDGIRHQLHFSNLGDSGIIVLRHIDSEVAGSLKRNRKTPRSERKSDLRVAFVSQQQLKSFNHPYQLGWTGDEMSEEDRELTSFKSACDSCSSSIHVRRGDIIIMATDGLFDNVDIDDIAEIALEWETEIGLIEEGDIQAREQRWAMGDSKTILSQQTISGLADRLCDRARANSLNKDIDSPFAILAKENDIMWSGGMPDDCTVIAMHVVGMPASDDPEDKSMYSI